MEINLSADSERAEWDEVWRNRHLRQLVSPVQINVAPMPDHTFGTVTHMDIAADPPQFEDSIWRKDNICPVCGNPTLVDSRIGVTIYPYFACDFSYGLGAWAHQSCLAACKEIAGPVPIPCDAAEQAFAADSPAAASLVN
jgi:ribosomal protein L37AE/L43A